MRVMDIAGRVLSIESISANAGINTHTIDVSGFAKGTYIISLQDKAGKKIVRFNVE